MSQVSKELILELQKIIKEEHGKELTLEEVSQIGNTMVGYFGLLAKLDTRMKSDEPDKEVFDKLVEEVTPRFKLDIDGVHGLSHWRRVKRIGLYLATGTDADWRVITLFSAIHDVCREDEYNDPSHGKRASTLAVELYQKGLLPVNDKQLDQLLVACENHSIREFKTDDLTVQTCLDADRLDLYRLGDVPDGRYLYTEKAKTTEARDFVLKLLGR